jgi:hypothetical protein
MLNGEQLNSQPKTGNRLASRVGRGLRRRRWYMGAVAGALAAGIIGAVSGPAAVAQTSPSACLSGYVCLVLSPSGTGNVALVAASTSQAFPSPGLPVTELANKTATLYCLEEKLSNGSTVDTSISAGSTVTVSASMLDAFPGPVCP